MNKNWNKKLVYSVIFLALSVTSFWLWSSGKHLASESYPNFSWFMIRNFNWPHAILDISFFGPLILGAIFIFLTIYFAIKGAEWTPNNIKKCLLIIVIATVASTSFLMFITALLSIFGS